MFLHLFYNQVKRLRGEVPLPLSVDWEYNVGLECSGLVDINTLPGFTSLAFILTEDEEFFSHRGFSKRAFLHRQALFLKSRSGFGTGSTISQQLVKQVFLDQRRTVQRKVLQLIYGHTLELEFSKDQILRMYLSSVRLGAITFGIKHGAQHYFQKTPAALALSEALYLAYMVRMPSLMNRCLVSKTLPKELKEFMRIKLFEIFFFYVSAYGVNALYNFEKYSFREVRAAFKDYQGRETYKRFDNRTYFEVEWLVHDHLEEFLSWYRNHTPVPSRYYTRSKIEVMRMEHEELTPRPRRG